MFLLGDAYLLGTSFTEGYAGFGADVEIDGYCSVGSDLVVNGNTTMIGNVSVTGATTLTGTVQIGTVRPVTSAYTPYALSVNGNILAKKLLVETSDWADYIFDRLYSLRSLAELESYIRANKHLPDVPTTCDATETGVDVGEMNRLLLQKVEELTLYVIQQQKEIDALKNK